MSAPDHTKMFQATQEARKSSRVVNTGWKGALDPKGTKEKWEETGKQGLSIEPKLTGVCCFSESVWNTWLAVEACALWTKITFCDFHET